MPKRLHRDLDLPGTIRPCTTVHEASGLALSSRNRYLSDEHRAQALGLSRALRAIRDEAARGTSDPAALRQAAQGVFGSHDLECDYVDVVDPDTFEPILELADAPALAIGAVRVGVTRLIDNRWIARPINA